MMLQGAPPQTMAEAEGEAGRVLRNFGQYNAYVEAALTCSATGDVAGACLNAAIAATVATSRHCGVFASPRLDRMLIDIGRRLDGDTPSPASEHRLRYRKVLHVCTQLAPTGGLTRMISRWIDADPERTNSVALTQHRGPIPLHFSQAVANSGGQIHELNHAPHHQIDWARSLRRLSQDFDVVILHMHCEDVVPILAFADPSKCPPVLLLNHADHLFWLGTGIAHAVINLRDAATDISATRRGVPPQRNLLLPTIVDPVTRTRSREAAKAALGVPPEDILLVSVARAAKYRNLDGLTFADRHVELLKRHPRARLLVVGPGDDPEDWREAKAAVDGRITCVAETETVRPYFEAADIYVDSYPFVSSTSMMEAAQYGAPLVTVFLKSSVARIIGINHVGLDGTSLVARSFAEYDALLSRLIEDETFRRSHGDRAQHAVEAVHTPPGWCERLEDIYQQSARLPLLDLPPGAGAITAERPELTELDLCHEGIFGNDRPETEAIKGYMPMLSLRGHLGTWTELLRRSEFHGVREALILLWPEWMRRAIKDRR